MKAYSYDLRLRVLRAVKQGRPRAEIVAMFAISLTTLKRYLKRQRETGDVASEADPRTPGEERSSSASWTLISTRCLPRRNTRRTLSDLGNHPRGTGQFCNDEPCDPTAELDTQEKDVASK
jgi:transposase